MDKSLQMKIPITQDHAQFIISSRRALHYSIHRDTIWKLELITKSAQIGVTGGRGYNMLRCRLLQLPVGLSKSLANYLCDKWRHFFIQWHCIHMRSTVTNFVHVRVFPLPPLILIITCNRGCQSSVLNFWTEVRSLNPLSGFRRLVAGFRKFGKEPDFRTHTLTYFVTIRISHVTPP